MPEDKHMKHQTIEHQRLADSEANRADWKNWGPYLSERAWGTVREDYSLDGDAWEYFTGETGAGLGASHQTGWTALVAKMIQDTRRQ